MREKRQQVTINRRQKENGRIGYDFAKEEDYNLKGKKVGHLTVLGIAPLDIDIPKRRGTERYWYCQCDCGSSPALVPTSYLGGKSGRGDYKQQDCGCLKTIRHFLACVKWDVSEEWLLQFREDWSRFRFIYDYLLKMFPHKSGLTTEQRKNFIESFFYEDQFNAVYDFWLDKNGKGQIATIDLARPSIDHIFPKTRGGENTRENLQFITLFENLAKRDLTWDEWQDFKETTHTQSDYFIDNILRNYKKEHNKDGREGGKDDSN